VKKAFRSGKNCAIMVFQGKIPEETRVFVRIAQKYRGMRQGEIMERFGLSRSPNKSHMGVSKNRGTPKWMVYKGKPY